MIAHSLLIGFIAFDGTALGPLPIAFTTGTPGVAGNRNFSGFKANTGNYQLRVGGPALTALNTPAQVGNEWSRSFGNQRALVTLSSVNPAVVLAYDIVRNDDNTWELFTFSGGAPADVIVSFSVEALIA
jgi:hypothetical protein